MTTTEQIAQALAIAGLGCAEFNPDIPESGCPDCEDVFRYATAVTPVVETLLADARTDGFRQGFTAGRAVTRERMS